MSFNSFVSKDLPILGSDVEISQIFDESIVLLSMLGPSNVPRKQRSDLKCGTNDSQIKWHLFLDQLSWLCDYKTGGKTVTSIAAEEVLHGLRFWLASNAKCVLMVTKHLKWVLQELQNLTIKAGSNLEDTQNRIFKESVKFSRERVENYSQRLSTVVQHSRNLRRDDRADQPLFQYLEELVADHQDHEKLCSSAFNFRKSPASKLLSERIARSDQSSIWALVRHYIGRLGSWWKASKILTTTVQTLPHLLKEFRVNAVQLRPAFSMPAIREEADISGARDRFLQFCDASRSQQVRGSLQRRWDQNFTKDFAERYRRRKTNPCMHAELLVLEYFCRKNLSFARDDRYIGCSKRSCYCCDLYMRVHPRGILPRPCHGNTWVKWQIPIEKNNKNTPARKEITSIMEKMIHRMRYDVLSNLLLDPTLKVSLESTTGISTAASS